MDFSQISRLFKALGNFLDIQATPFDFDFSEYVVSSILLL